MSDVKNEIRGELKKRLSLISSQRREEATSSFFLHFSHRLSLQDKVLSFSSFRGELDTSLLNLFLAHTKKLYLPKIEGSSLEIYQVSNLEKELIRNSYGILEPNPTLCQKASLTDISVALIPGLGFDTQNRRIGYGRGFYDRFLPNAQETLLLGIGFREQLMETIPCEVTDFPLSEVFLF